jgi:UDP-2,4-diacetamido-2,4,6-trideoxy-beta-L-altropyranose hydrolase
MKPRIAFRVDVSEKIGTGHLARCLALAGVLCEIAETFFICRHVDQTWASRIASEGHRLVRLDVAGDSVPSAERSGYALWLGVDWTDDARETLTAIVGIGAPLDWLVVDHYALDAHWESALRAIARNILVIDDLADRDHDCDFLLDQNFHPAPEQRYRRRVGKNCRLLLGPSYALLRSEFARERGFSVLREAIPQRILTFMGGVDAAGHTRKVIQAFLGLGRKDLVLEVALASTNPYLPELTTEFGATPQIEFCVDVSDMASRLRRADIAVGAGGISTWERCCLGLPSITLSIAENQDKGAQELGAVGATLYLGRAAEADVTTIQAALQVLLNTDSLRQTMAANAARLVDGLGAERVACRMLSGELQLRPAVLSDRDAILAWRNDESTRRHSGDDGVIDAMDHARWFAGVLGDPGRKLLIAEENDRPVGVLRYDIKESEAEVSIYLLPGLAGHGLGWKLLAAGETWLAAAAPGVRCMLARVRSDNVVSLRLFESAGYERQTIFFRKELHGNA